MLLKKIYNKIIKLVKIARYNTSSIANREFNFKVVRVYNIVPVVSAQLLWFRL